MLRQCQPVLESGAVALCRGCGLAGGVIPGWRLRRCWCRCPRGGPVCGARLRGGPGTPGALRPRCPHLVFAVWLRRLPALPEQLARSPSLALSPWGHVTAGRLLQPRLL